VNDAIGNKTRKSKCRILCTFVFICNVIMNDFGANIIVNSLKTCKQFKKVTSLYAILIKNGSFRGLNYHRKASYEKTRKTRKSFGKKVDDCLDFCLLLLIFAARNKLRERLCHVRLMECCLNCCRARRRARTYSLALCPSGHRDEIQVSNALFRRTV